MPGIMPKFVLPTGYEDEQLKAERKRRIAQALLERGLATNPNMQSWTQVLGQLAQAGVGRILDKRADKIDSDVRARELADYGTKIGAFNAATTGANVDPQDIVRRFGSDPMLQDQVSPYVDALKKRLTEKENIVRTPTAFRRQGDVVNQPIFDPNAMMVPTGQPGQYGVNAARVTAALAAQPNTTITGAQTTITDPTTQPPPQAGTPLPPVQGLPSGEAPQPLPQPAPGDAPYSGMDLSLLNPDERQILTNELKRRAGGGAGNYQLQNDTHVPMGSPLTAIKPPAGVAGGKPYWIINGVPYDNPEGR